MALQLEEVVGMDPPKVLEASVQLLRIVILNNNHPKNNNIRVKFV